MQQEYYSLFFDFSKGLVGVRSERVGTVRSKIVKDELRER